MVFRLSTAARNAAADAITALLGSAGIIRFYTGGQPANPQTAASGTLLATVTLPGATGAAVAGVDTLLDPVAVTPVASGTVGWCRFLDSAGTTVMGDALVSASGGGGDIIASSTAWNTGTQVDLSAIPLTVPESV